MGWLGWLLLIPSLCVLGPLGAQIIIWSMRSGFGLLRRCFAPVIHRH
jgi:hypothetical protein